MGTVTAPTGKHRQAGFTLVELLVAMTLLAFLSLSLFGGLRFGARSWDAVVGSSAERDAIASTQTFLRARLSEMTAPSPDRPDPEDEIGRLGGSETSVEFTAPWLSALSLGGLYRFTLWHDDEEDGRLMLRWQPDEAIEDSGEDLGDLVGERVLLDGVSDVALSYYGITDEDDQPDWRDRWENPERPPQMLRLELEFADAGVVWPAFIVALKN
ncbi:MAG TPA: prepilin-type N-terminal cleavage/methylation domain-containing protein [Thermohalobaculum sp.]|nr:prepilin-type N-terminal cleavage/methylation domain-containing protein [Thermohalobaculum sp.]